MQTERTLADDWHKLAEATRPCPIRTDKEHGEECELCVKGQVPIFDPKLMWEWVPTTPTSPAHKVPTEPHLETLLAASPKHVKRAILEGLSHLEDHAPEAVVMEAAITAAEKVLKDGT